MKKHYYFRFLLLLIPVSAFVLMSVSGGRNGAYSGSPGDNGTTCTQCHSGGNFNASVVLQTEIPVEGYDLNTSYGINVDVSSISNSRHGFQITAERVSDGSKIGTFTADGTDNQLVNGGTHITHTFTGNSKKSWNFQWKSPSTNVGDVKFYVAALAGNGAGTGGDEVVTTASTVNVLGIAEANRLEFDMYPNPASNNLTIQLPSGSEKAVVQLYDNIGRLALTKNISSSNNKLSVNNLSTGIYILKILSDGKIGSQKFMKK